MLVLGIQKNGRKKKVVHVDNVPNGFKCNCICPNPDCADQLSAKNNCKEMSNHFAHRTRVEGRTCLMSQLHLAAQHYFLPLKSFTLPKHVFAYDGCTLGTLPQTVVVQSVELEASVDKFRVDVLLHTEVGPIIIEILVTSKCSDEKSEFLTRSKRPALEYDLSSFVDAELEQTMAMLANNAVPYEWIYGWSQRQLIESYLEEKEAERKKELLKQKRSAAKSANKLIAGSYLMLPSIDEQFECTLEGEVFKEEVRLFTRKEFKLLSLEIDSEQDEYLLLKGTASNSQGSRQIWAAYVYTPDIPGELKAIKDAVVVRIPARGDKAISTWRWLNNPKLNQLRAEKMREFQEQCSQELVQLKAAREYIENVNVLAKQYADNQDTYFHQGYGIWKRWLIDNNLFTPSASKKNPSIPRLIKEHRKHPHLWMFDSWHVLLIAKLAKIIDDIPINTLIDSIEVFSELSIEFGLHPAYLELEFNVHRKFLDESMRDLVLRKQVIGSTLSLFMISGSIKYHESGYYRVGSLLSDLKR